MHPKVCLTALSTGIPYRLGCSITPVRPAKTTQRTGKVVRSKGPNLVGTRPSETKPAPDRGAVHGRCQIAREAKGITKTEVARKLGVSKATVGDWENGDTRSPTAENLLNMRDKLGYNIDFIVRGTGMPLMPNFEQQAKEAALMSIFRDLKPEHRESVLTIAQNLRRAQGGGPNPNDPFLRDAPKDGDDN